MGIQLQKFVSLTTSGTSGAATLSNGVLNVPNYDTSGGGAWVDYSATSTIVGWSSFTSGWKTIKYRIVGKQMFVLFALDGISNSTTTTFTLPFNSVNVIRIIGSCYCVNNGVTVGGYYANVKDTSTIQGFTGLAASAWTSSGTKTFIGQLFYEIA